MGLIGWAPAFPTPCIIAVTPLQHSSAVQLLSPVRSEEPEAQGTLPKQDKAFTGPDRLAPGAQLPAAELSVTSG